MSTVTLADRRAIMKMSMLQPDFRDLLRRDPRSAVQRATGRAAPEDAVVSVVEEGADAWEFVVPASIDGELPLAASPRDILENEVYALLRDDPAIRPRVLGEPRGLVAEKFQLDLLVNVREERPGELVLILARSDGREELPDSALDLVAGGSMCTPTASGGDWNSK